jgi:hypothetical protein
MCGRSVVGMPKLMRSIVSVLARRFRSRAVLELENLALRHQLHVLRRQRPGRPGGSRSIACFGFGCTDCGPEDSFPYFFMNPR